MNIEVTAAGKATLGVPQQRWSAGPNGDDAGSFETALFGGQRLTVLTDDEGGFTMQYLGFQSRGFQTMDAAKLGAPSFARAVLARMGVMISE